MIIIEKVVIKKVYTVSKIEFVDIKWISSDFLYDFRNTVVVLLHSENSLFSHKRAISRQCYIDFAVSVSAVFFFPPLLDFSIDGKLLSQCCVQEQQQLLFGS